MSTLRRIGVMIAVAAMLASCSSGGPQPKPTPKPILGGNPVPAQVGDAIPFAPVRYPVQVDTFWRDPCGNLTREQLAALVADPPDQVGTFAAGHGAVGCTWKILTGPMLAVEVPTARTKNLSELAAERENVPSMFEQWREFSLDGLPVVEYFSSASMEKPSKDRHCQLAVGVNDTEMLAIRYGVVGGGKSQYWGEDRCAGALKAAEFVIGNLRGR